MQPLSADQHSKYPAWCGTCRHRVRWLIVDVNGANSGMGRVRYLRIAAADVD